MKNIQTMENRNFIKWQTSRVFYLVIKLKALIQEISGALK